MGVFRWSNDDKFFARMTQDGALSIYETPSFGLLDKKSIKVEGLKGFSWSPKDNIIAYWVAEAKDVPARVVLLEIPSRKELRVKNLFNVADRKMLENKDVKYAGMYHNFEIFHMNEKQIPVDTVKIEETVHAFSWEPVGSKFAVIHGESQQLNVSFYGLKKGTEPEILKKYERKTANHIFWAPTGQFVDLAGLRSMNGVLEFVDTSDFTSMGVGEHFMCTDVEWDPTGRYVITGVSWWGHKVDNAYWMWNFQGKILKRSNVDRFCQLVWRPRPQTLLSKEKLKDVKKNLKRYSDIFNLKDKMRQNKASKELVAKRQTMMEEFKAWKDRKAKEFLETKERRMELRGGFDADDHQGEAFEEEVVEFLVKEESTLMQD